MGLPAAEEITFRQNTDQLARLIDDRQATDMVLKHKSGRLEDSGIRIDQDNGVRHYILGLHGSSPLIKEFSPQIRAATVAG
jgi:hypothetical protein